MRGEGTKTCELRSFVLLVGESHVHGVIVIVAFPFYFFLWWLQCSLCGGGYSFEVAVWADQSACDHSHS